MTHFPKLKSPQDIQDFLNRIPFNFEDNPMSYFSPTRALRENRAHCFEGALIGAMFLEQLGHKPLLLDLKVEYGRDDDHVVAIFKINGCWGALSKTSHAVLRYREPIYKSVRELALSYFHEYFLSNGHKTLRSFSKPFDLSKTKIDWRTGEKDLNKLVQMLDRSPHTQILSKKQIKNLRRADKIEIKAGEIRAESPLVKPKAGSRRTRG
jgi:hypothetical protein